ncbi:DUF3800 domain-containing protein [Polaribacter ponticola]|uniref:DUF3800 domain-containing protein n=1 Tax=Polaribacter ponticola TaxID=2978475 RepID=A0ABT5SCD9_9FLAO|nr:DUF3800 domain-containing protein [Polaribacter sp. MSW5]MDD7915484.1 DUF3800 domain-containing protein [Polaribacter sp. MSW5]
MSEIKKTFNLYCDESTHLQYDEKPFMVISYIKCAYPQIKQHKAYIKLLKEKHNFYGEMKWSKISKSNAEFYNDVIDYFFATDLSFRAIVVDKNQIDESREGFTYNDFYFRMYYQLIAHKMHSKHFYNLYLDIKDTRSQQKLVGLKEILNNKSNVRNIQFIKSYESYLMQIADVMMGAINYHIRGLNKVTAKNRVIEKMQTNAKINLKKSTPKEAEKFNLFYIDLS